MGKQQSRIAAESPEDVANETIGTKKTYQTRPVNLYWSGPVPIVKPLCENVRKRLCEMGVPDGTNPWPIVVEFRCHSENLAIYNLILLRDYSCNKLTVVFPPAHRLDSLEEMDTANGDPSVLCVGFGVPELNSKEFYKLQALIVVRILQLLDKSISSRL